MSCMAHVGTGNMAQGLRQSFSSPARAWTPLLLEKLKEKNTAVTNNSTTGLKVFFQHCIALQDVAEDISAALDHKNPKVKLETLKVLQVSKQVARGSRLPRVCALAAC